MSCLESWYRPGPECQQTEAQWQKVNTEILCPVNPSGPAYDNSE